MAITAVSQVRPVSQRTSVSLCKSSGIAVLLLLNLELAQSSSCCIMPAECGAEQGSKEHFPHIHSHALCAAGECQTTSFCDTVSSLCTLLLSAGSTCQYNGRSALVLTSNSSVRCTLGALQPACTHLLLVLCKAVAQDMHPKHTSPITHVHALANLAAAVNTAINLLHPQAGPAAHMCLDYNH